MNKASVFLWLTFLIVATGLLWAFFMLQESYTPERPAEDCSEPNEFPVCRRAVTPDEKLPASSTSVFIAFISLFVFSLILIVAAFKSSIMSQKDLVVTGKTEEKTTPVTKAHKSWQTGHSPKTIVDNDIPEEAVKRG